MSIWVELMLNALPSKAIDFVIPVIACLVAVYANACGRGANAAIEPLLMIRPRRMKPPSIGTSAWIQLRIFTSSRSLAFENFNGFART